MDVNIHLLVFDPLQLPLDDDLSQVHSQLPLLYGDAGREAQPLHGADHVLHQVVAHRVVHLQQHRQRVSTAMAERLCDAEGPLGGRLLLLGSASGRISFKAKNSKYFLVLV